MTYSEQEVKELMAQAWRAAFLATDEGHNGEYIGCSGESVDEDCQTDVASILAGTKKSTSIAENFTQGPSGSSQRKR